jgi:hypothetical protein
MKRKRKQIKYEDENVLNAIELRNQKQKHTDYYFKLLQLRDKIDVYNFIFKSNKPKYLYPTKVCNMLNV